MRRPAQPHHRLESWLAGGFGSGTIRVVGGDAVNRPDSLLCWLAERCQQNLAANVGAQEFLRSNGIADESVWRQYRLGVGDDGLLAALDDAGRSRLLELGLTSCRAHNPLATSAFVLPTFDPRSPDVPVGFVGVSPAQNKHKFLSKPTGVACPNDINGQQLIILADAPLLTLRLAQAGSKGACLVEDVAVLSTLADWLKTKTLVVASYKKKGLKNLKATLSALGIEAKAAIVNANIAHTPPSSLKTMGLGLEIIEQGRIDFDAGLNVAEARFQNAEKRAVHRRPNSQC